MPKCIFQRHISPERYLITPFDQFLSSFPCCQFVTAFALLFQLWSTGTVSTILHDSMDESVDCIFIVHIYKSTFKYIKLYILLFSTLNLNCFNGTLLKCECGNEWKKVYKGGCVHFQYSSGQKCHLKVDTAAEWHVNI